MKVSGLSMVAAVGVLGVAAAAVVARGDDQNSDKEVKWVSRPYSTEWFLVQADDVSKPGINLGSGNAESIHVLNKPGGTFTVGTSSANECGKYTTDGGSSYSNSTTFTGTFYETSVIFLTDSRDPRVPVNFWFRGAQPAKGKKVATLAFYREHASDDAQCVDNGGKTYFKGTGTMD